MLILEQVPDTNLLLTTATGTLEQADYDRMLPRAEAIIERYGGIRWLFEMRDFDGWTAGAAWRDLKFDLRHVNDFERVAIVGKQQWMDTMTQLMKPFTRASVRHFPPGQKAEALAWLRE